MKPKPIINDSDHDGIDADAFEYLVVLEELYFAVETVKEPKKQTQKRGNLAKWDHNDKNNYQNIVKYPRRIILENNQQDFNVAVKIDSAAKNQNQNQIIEETKSIKAGKFNNTIQDEDQNEEEEDNQKTEEIKHSFTKKRSQNASLIQSNLKVLQVAAKEEDISFNYRNWLAKEKQSEGQNRPEQQKISRSNDQNKAAAEKCDQQKTISQKLSPKLDKTASDYDKKSNYKQFSLSMWRIDIQLHTKILVAQQIISIQPSEVSVFKEKLFFSSDKTQLILILMNKNDQTVSKILIFSSTTLKQVSPQPFSQNQFDFLKKEKEFPLDPVLFRLTYQEQDQEKSMLAIYFQDGQKGYLVFQNQDKWKDQQFKLQQKEKANPLILNIFFQLEGKAIIFTQTIRNDKAMDEGDKKILYQTYVVNVSLILDAIEKNKNKTILEVLNNLENDQTDYFISKNNAKEISEDQENLIFFYNQRLGIFIINTSKPKEQNQQEPDKIKTESTIFYIQQTDFQEQSKGNATKEKAQHELKIFKMQNLRLPQNPQLLHNLSFKEQIGEEDYITQFYQLQQKGSSQEQLKLRVPKVSYALQSNMNKFQDFIVTYGNENTTFVFEVNLDNSVHPSKSSVIYYDNRDQSTIVHPPITIEKQAVHYNEPYIIVVEDQTKVNIYSTVFPQRNYTLDLQNHFEFFLDVPAGDVKIDKEEEYFRHQVCMMVTYDIERLCHRIEVIVMPTFKDMKEDQDDLTKDDSFKIITMPYQLQINIGNSQIFLREHILAAQFLQVQNQKEKEYENTLLLQTKDRVVILKIQKSEKKQLQNNNDGQLNKNDDILEFTYQASYFQTNQDKILICKTEATHIWNKKKTKIDKNQKQNDSEKPLLYLVYNKQIECSQLTIINANSQKNNEEIEQFNLYQFQTRKSKNDEFNDLKSDEIMQISEQEDKGNLTVLILFRNFVIKKLKFNNENDYVGKFDFESVPIKKAKDHWENTVKNPIIINDQGIYLDDCYYQYFDKSIPDLKLKSINDFEDERIKKVCFQTEKIIKDDLKINHSLKSPDRTQIMMQFNIKETIDQLPIENQYFITFPLMRSKVKNLIPIDTFSKQKILHSSYLGTKENDILLRTKEGKFIVFSQTFGLYHVKDDKNSDFDLNDYHIKDMALCQSQNDQGKETQKFIILLTKNQNQVAVLIITKSDKNLYQFKLEKPEVNKEEEIFLEKNIISIIKLTPEGEVVKFYLNNSATITFNSLKQEMIEFKKDSFYFSIAGKRQTRIETEFIKMITQSFNEFAKNKALQKKIEEQKKQKVMQQQMANEVYVRFDGKRQSYRFQQVDEENLFDQNLEVKDFDFQFLPKQDNGKQYLVLKYKTNLYFCKTHWSNLKKVALNLNQSGSINQILPVQSRQHVQFLYHDKMTKNFHMFVWNLGKTETKSKNEEEQMQKFRATKQSPFYLLIKGTKLRENYLFFQDKDSFIDLRSDLPLNFLSGRLAWSQFYQSNEYVNELKICSTESHCLGFNGLALTQIQRSYSFIDLQYIEYLNKKFKKKRLEDDFKQLQFEYMNIMLPYQSNLLHYFSLNQQFLQTYLKEIQNNLQKADKIEKQKIMNFSYYPLCSNSQPIIKNQSKGRKPFSIALKRKNIECFELIVQILSTDTNRSYIIHIKPYLIQLMLWRGPIVHNFLLNKCQKLLFTKKVLIDKNKKKGCFLFRSCQLKNKQIEKVNQNKSITQYINSSKKYKLLEGDPVKENFKIKDDKILKQKHETLKKKITMNVNEIFSDDEQEDMIIKKYKKSLKYQNKEEYINIQEQQLQQVMVQVYAFDFKNYFIGEESQELLSFLINQSDNLSVFELQYTQKLIEYQWKKIKKRYTFILILYSLKIVMMIIYVVSQDQDHKCNYSQDLQIDYKIECSTIIYNTWFSGNDNFWYELIEQIWIPLMISQIAITIYDAFRYLFYPKISSFACFFFNLINLMKIITDQILIKQFSYALLNQEDSSTDRYNQIDKKYLDRYNMINIMIIRGGNAFMLITLPLLLFYMIRFLPIMNQNVPRFFIALKAILPITFFFMIIAIFLRYTYDILGSMAFNVENIDWAKIITKQTESKNKFLIGYGKYLSFSAAAFYVERFDEFNHYYRNILYLVLAIIVTIFFQFIGSSISKADSLASKNLKSQKFLNLALLVRENSFLLCCCKQRKFKNARYIIVSHREKAKMTAADGKKVNPFKDCEEKGEMIFNGQAAEGGDNHSKIEAVTEKLNELVHSFQEMKVMMENLNKKIDEMN